MSTVIDRKPALSISAMSMLSRCGEQYRRRYIEHERLAPGVSLLVGKSVDSSVNENLTHKMATTETLTVAEVASVARDTFEREWTSQQIALSEDEVRDGVLNTKGAAVDKTVRLAELHATAFAPNLQPTAVQRKWVLELPNYPMDLIGYTDVEEGNTVRDTKTSGKTPREDEADLSDQLTIYALAKRVLDKIEGPIKVTLDYLVDLKTPKAIVRQSTRDVDDYQVMLRRIEVAQNAIEKQVFVPATRDQWFCSAKWCGFYSTCPFVRQPKSVFLGGEISYGQSC